MNKKLANPIFLIITFLISTLVVSLGVQRVKASGTIYIKADGSIEPLTANITTPDNVTYTFTDNNHYSIIVERDNIVVDGAGYTVQGAGNEIGIVLSYRSNITLKNTIVKGFSNGIYLGWSKSNTLTNNTVTSNSDRDICLEDSTNNTLTHNVASSSSNGIEVLSNSNNNTLRGNKISNNTYGIRFTCCDGNVIIGNTVLENGFGIYIDESNDNLVAANNVSSKWWGIGVDKSTNNIITNNNAFNCDIGNFGLWGSEFSHFNNNVSTSNLVDGKPVYYFLNNVNTIINSKTNAGTVYLINCKNISVMDLTFSRNGNGVFLWNTTNTKIKNITAINNVAGSGIRCHLSNNNRFIGNTLASNALGIKLYDSNYNTIIGNLISRNNYFGVELQNALCNSIYHNNIIENYHQIRQYNSSTVWNDNYPSGGNYWSNYSDLDLHSGRYQNETGSDGILDYPYVIDEYNQDDYPLMGLFSSFNAASENHVQIICNSSISDFQFNGTAVSFSVTGENATTSFCRVSIPHDLVSEPYNVTIDGANPIYWNYTLYDNGTHRWIYFTYEHSELEIVVVPEFHSLIILPLFMLATLLTTGMLKKRINKV